MKKPTEKQEKKLKKKMRQLERKAIKGRLKEIRKIKPQGLPKYRDSKKKVKYREKATRGTLTALGVVGGQQTYKGAGRPRGSYKYGMPIQVYKKMIRDKKALYQRYQQEQYARLRPKGFTPEQIQQLQQQQTYQELEQPSASRVQRIQQRVQQIRQVQQQPTNIIPPRSGFQKMRVPTNMHNKLVQPGPSIADEELKFRKWSAETTISPNTQRMLDTIRRIQNKGKTDNIEQQRRIRERNMVGRSMNLMKAHENMINTDMDMTGVNEENILMAPNVFREIQGNHILQNNRGAFSLLNTREAGNNLKFF